MILAILSRLEDKVDKLIGLDAKVDKLQQDMTIMCSFKDTTNRTIQEFEDYKRTRETLPAQISEVKSDLDNHCISTKDIPELVKKHEKIFSIGVGILVTLNLFMLVLEAGRYILGPTNWGWFHL